MGNHEKKIDNSKMGAQEIQRWGIMNTKVRDQGYKGGDTKVGDHKSQIWGIMNKK